MINIPYEALAEKITEKAGISKEELDKRVKSKLEQLSGLISKEGAAHIIANELGINLAKTEGLLKIKNLMPGIRNAEVIGRVIRKYEVRNFSTEKRSGKVGRFLLGDETGTTMIVLWNDQADILEKLNEKDILRIQGATVKSNNGRNEVHINESTKIDINPEGVKLEPFVPNSERTDVERKKIKDLKQEDSNVEIFGTIVQVFDLKFFEVCPECGKRTKKEESDYVCRQHGKISPVYSAVLNVFADDGSDNIRIVLWRDQVESLIGRKDLNTFREDPSSFEEIKTELLGLMAKFKGRVSKNEMFDRLEFVANQVIKNVNPEEEMKNLESKTESKQEIKQESKKSEPSADDELLSLDELEDLE